MSEDSNAVEPPARGEILSTRIAFAVQAVLLLVSAFQHRDAINPDAIAYIQTARHYLEGNTDLMVNGYWGPLLSWLVAAAMVLVDDPLLAARLAMAVSGGVFLAGCVTVLRCLGLPAGARIAGTWIASSRPSQLV